MGTPGEGGQEGLGQPVQHDGSFLSGDCNALQGNAGFNEERWISGGQRLTQDSNERLDPRGVLSPKSVEVAPRNGARADNRKPAKEVVKKGDATVVFERRLQGEMWEAIVISGNNVS